MRPETPKLSKQVSDNIDLLNSWICDFKYIFNLLQGGDKSAEDILRERFAAKNSNIDAFSSIRYGMINNEKWGSLKSERNILISTDM